VEDQRDWLLALGFGRRKTATALPAQATIYRFMWALEQQAVALEKALQLWARDALQALGQHQEAGLLKVSLDGQHLKGSAGDKAIVLVFAYLRRLQSKAAGDEAAAGRGGGCSGRGQDALDAAQTAQVVLQKGAPLPPSQG